MRYASRVGLLVCALAPHTVTAQDTRTVPVRAGTYGRVSMSIAQSYDDNLFATPGTGSQQSDLISRFGPAFEAGYLGARLDLTARYAVDGERYLDRAEFDDDIARQDAALDVRYRPTARFGLRVGAAYVDTQTPRELNLTSFLAVARARAERLTGRSGATYQISAVTGLTLDYEFTENALEGGVSSAVHTSRFGLERHPSPRNAYRADYRARRASFDGTARETSHVLTAGWAYGVTPLTRVELDAGPRITAGSIRPEFSALVRRRLRRGEMSVAYARTQDIALGGAGSLEVARLTASVSHAPTRYLTLTASPALVRSTRDVSRFVVRELDVAAVVRATPRVSFAASGRFGQQAGRAAGTRIMIPYRGLSLTSTVTVP